jgi:hypothetical protein
MKYRYAETADKWAIALFPVAIAILVFLLAWFINGSLQWSTNARWGMTVAWVVPSIIAELVIFYSE